MPVLPDVAFLYYQVNSSDGNVRAHARLEERQQTHSKFRTLVRTRCIIRIAEFGVENKCFVGIVRTPHIVRTWCLIQK